VVLGGAGFIGRWVIHTLAGRGAHVTAVTRSPAAAWVSSALHDPSGVTEWDLAEGGVEELLHVTRPDIVFNLCGYGVDPSERDADLSARLNAGVVVDLCRALRDRPAPAWGGIRLVHVGSALEYGEAVGDLDEETDPVPTTVYGSTKLDGTRAVEEAASEGFAATTARLFTVFGPGEHSTRLLPTLLSAAGTDEAIPLTSGTQLRDFTFVGDVAEGLLRLGAVPGLEHPTVNLATGVLTEVRDFVALCARTAGIAPERLRFGALPTRKEEMAHEPVSVRRLRRYLDWVPPTTVREGLLETVSQVLGRSAARPRP
jgi:nucleoside-diphosphate-sugar epimerase